ncbi:MAG: LTA synthase family protein [Chitinophagaceae bacterium]
MLSKADSKARLAAQSFYPLFIALAALFIAERIVVLVADAVLYGIPDSFAKVIICSLVADILFLSSAGLILYLVYLLVFSFSRAAARIIFIIIAVLLVTVQALLSQYFLKSLVPLGADIFGYSYNDIQLTVSAAAGSPILLVLSALLFIGIVTAALIYLPKKIHTGPKRGFILFTVFILSLFINFFIDLNSPDTGNEHSNNLALNRSMYFYSKGFGLFFHRRDVAVFANQDSYPFLHATDSADVLSPFFNKAAVRPNIVFIIVEGLGSAFSQQNARLGSFTPFLDSLSEHSLYWENFLSAGGRTFAALPSLMGSLPFGANGFNELGDKMPAHFSLFSLLKHNGYRRSFHYGSNREFDNMNFFLRQNGVKEIYDEKDFPVGATRMPDIGTGKSWGYGDKELFERYYKIRPGIDSPMLDVLLTLSSHNPFRVNEEEKYLALFESRMQELGLNESQKKHRRYFKYQLSSIMYMDDALRSFMKVFSKRADFSNTVFIITGDHCMTEIPPVSKIDQFHVPLILYSPLLKRTGRFTAVSTHFDVAPSLLQWLKNDYGLDIPAQSHWLGSGLDTARQFRSAHVYPLMRTKSTVDDFVMGDYMLSGKRLFMLKPGLKLERVNDRPDIYQQLKQALDSFGQKNDLLRRGVALLPDSLYQKYVR